MAYLLLRTRRRLAALVSLASFLIVGSANIAPLHADVVGIGDITPAIPNPDPPPNVDIPDLPQFGGPVNGGTLIVGGTGQFVGGTEAGQMTIDIPTDTDPLVADNAAIGFSQGGQGSVRVLGLNSEFTVNQFLHVGVLGQGALQVSAGARVGQPANASLTDFMATFVGYGEGSQGFVTVDGFVSLLKSYTLSVGRAGSGTMTVTNGGRIETTFEAQIGGDAFVGNSNDTDLVNGVGLVTLDGQATRWNVGIPVVTNPAPPGLPSPPINNTAQVADMYVGKYGRGNLQIQNQAWARVSRDVFIGFEDNSYGETTVTGLGSTLWAIRDLNVGSIADDNAGGSLNIDADGLVRADRDVNIGVLGFVNMGGGTLQMIQSTPGGALTNNGVIRGDGRIDTGLTETVTNNGYIRNGASVANLRERLLFTGPVVNNDNIESVGGEMEFQDLVTNNGPEGDIVGINAIYRFNGGLVNTGNLYFKNSLVWYGVGAPATVTSSANLVVLEGETQFMGNLALTGTNELAIELGHSSSLLSVSGTAALGGRLLVTAIDDLLGEGAGDGWEPNVGDSFEILTANSVSGMFADVDDTFVDFDFEAIYEPTRVLLTVTGRAPPVTGDFDGDGDVDGADFLAWQQNYGKSPNADPEDGDANGDGDVDDLDFADWKLGFGSSTANPAVGAVPEPATAALALMALVLPLARRRR